MTPREIEALALQTGREHGGMFLIVVQDEGLESGQPIVQLLIILNLKVIKL
ncbi:MAG: hypothetical protein ACU0B5_14230 [Roseovarius sp.]